MTSSSRVSSNVDWVRVNPRALLAVQLEPRFNAIHPGSFDLKVDLVAGCGLKLCTVADYFQRAFDRSRHAQFQPAASLNLVAHYCFDLPARESDEGESGRIAQPVVCDKCMAVS